jgi:hypothetical protein
VIVEHELNFSRARIRDLDVRALRLAKTPLADVEKHANLHLYDIHALPHGVRVQSQELRGAAGTRQLIMESESGGLRQLAYPQLGVAPRERQRYQSTRMLSASYPF